MLSLEPKWNTKIEERKENTKKTNNKKRIELIINAIFWINISKIFFWRYNIQELMLTANSCYFYSSILDLLFFLIFYGTLKIALIPYLCFFLIIYIFIYIYFWYVIVKYKMSFKYIFLIFFLNYNIFKKK